MICHDPKQIPSPNHAFYSIEQRTKATNLRMLLLERWMENLLHSSSLSVVVWLQSTTFLTLQTLCLSKFYHADLAQRVSQVLFYPTNVYMCDIALTDTFYSIPIHSGAKYISSRGLFVAASEKGACSSQTFPRLELPIPGNILKCCNPSFCLNRWTWHRRSWCYIHFWYCHERTTSVSQHSIYVVS